MHELIIGRTLSGKTTYATKKAHSQQKRGVSCIILDRFNDPRWQLDKDLCFITGDRDAFLDTVWKSKGCAIFVDEAGSEIGKYSDLMNELATQGRHWGHKCYFITQRAKQLSTTVRCQCSSLVIFKQSKNDTKDLADEFVEPMINDAHALELGEFILVRHGKKTEKLNVFNL